ncbi:MAG: hypothetical protein M3512_14055 [Bacteroidota bacterium]|nr:hypothetical protein [Bacteroidota bacterium]
MKKIIHKILILGAFLSFYGQAVAQLPEVIHTVPISQPESVSIDRFNNIYISDKKGNIVQYDPAGKFLQKYSPTKQITINSLESWQAIKIFAFSQDFQQVLFLDRFLYPAPAVFIRDLPVGFIRAATISIDNHLWLIDDTDLSLKKYDVLQKKIIIHSPLNLQLGNNTFDINYIKEYQNHLFINDKNNGILMFDVMGNYLKSIPIKNLNYFNFYNNELYYLERDKVVFYDFYKLKERSIELPAGPKSFILATETKLFIISDANMRIYSFKESE